MPDHVQTLLTALEASLADDTFVKLTLGKPRNPASNGRKILIRAVSLAKGVHLSFIHRHAAKDETRNLPIDEGLAEIQALLGKDYLSASLFTTTNDLQLTMNDDKSTRLRRAKPTFRSLPSKQHNRPKNRPIASAGNTYLTLLGVTTSQDAVKKGMEAKYRQINRFIEIIDPLLGAAPVGDEISVLDMGCGKGYLTFALYDYLTVTLKKKAQIAGVEARQELVDLCNGVARQVGFAGLRFQCGTIRDLTPSSTDIVIALHACDTATDEALFKAIQADAALILCAPCCHKELRPQIRCAVSGLDRVLKSGILLEREAEIVTDGMRALLLEASGYKTSVFEFIAAEHTSKNIMIAAVKTAKAPDQAAVWNQISNLKAAFGINGQCLERLLRPSG